MTLRQANVFELSCKFLVAKLTFSSSADWKSIKKRIWNFWYSSVTEKKHGPFDSNFGSRISSSFRIIFISYFLHLYDDYLFHKKNDDFDNKLFWDFLLDYHSSINPFLDETTWSRKILTAASCYFPRLDWLKKQCCWNMTYRFSKRDVLILPYFEVVFCLHRIVTHCSQWN